jgi:TrmH family RNA methyltransferase
LIHNVCYIATPFSKPQHIMEPITSAQNGRYKNALRLHSSRGRQQQNRIIVFGQREISRAVAAGIQFVEFIIDAEQTQSPAASEIESIAETQNAPLLSLSGHLFKELAYGDRNDGVVGIAPRPETDIDRLKVASPSLVFILESLEKPGNLGAIARSADGCGIDGLLIADRLTDPFHPNAIRASVATVFSVPIACESSSEIQRWLALHEFQIFAATPEAETSIYDFDFSKISPAKIAFVFGNEANGLSEAWRDANHHSIKLPMRGIADSLNVSVTASLFMYEARRQLSF